MHGKDDISFAVRMSLFHEGFTFVVYCLKVDGEPSFQVLTNMVYIDIVPSMGFLTIDGNHPKRKLDVP